MNKEYKPFDEEWKAEVNKLPKKVLIDLYRDACIKNIESLPVEAGVMPNEVVAGGSKRLEQDLISIKRNMERWLSIKDEYRAKEEVYILETKQTCEILLEELASQREA